MGKKIVLAFKVLILSYVITAVLLFLSAFLMYKIGIGESTMRVFVMVIYGIATFTAGLTYVKAKKNRKLLNGAFMGIMYFVILTIVSLAVNHALYGDMKKAAISLCVCVVGGIMGGMMG